MQNIKKILVLEEYQLIALYFRNPCLHPLIKILITNAIVEHRKTIGNVMEFLI